MFTSTLSVFVIVAILVLLFFVERSRRRLWMYRIRSNGHPLTVIDEKTKAKVMEDTGADESYFVELIPGFYGAADNLRRGDLYKLVDVGTFDWGRPIQWDRQFEKDHGYWPSFYVWSYPPHAKLFGEPLADADVFERLRGIVRDKLDGGDYEPWEYQTTW